MKRSILTISSMLGLVLSLSGQPSFLKSYGLTQESGPLTNMPSTGGYLMVGTSQEPNGSYPIHFLQLDPNGQVQGNASMLSIQRTIEIYSLTTLADGRMVAGGLDFDGSFAYGLLVELDANGQVQRTRDCDYGLVGYWSNLVATPDTGFLAMGQGFISTPYYRAVVAKFDAQGDTVWTRGYGRPDHTEEFITACVLPSGDYLVAGVDRDDIANTSAMTVHRINAIGQRIWAKNYLAIGQFLRPNAMTLDGDKVYFSIGLQDSVNFNTHAGMLAMDTAGTVLWANSIGGPDESWAGSTALTAAGHPVLLGGYNTGQDEVALSMGFSANGSLLWSNGYSPGGSVVASQPVPGGHVMTMADANLGGLLALVGPQFELAVGCSTLTPNLPLSPFALTEAFYNPTTRSGFNFIARNFNAPAFTLNDSTVCSGLVGNSVAVPSVQARVVPQPMRSAARIELPAPFDPALAALEVYDLAGRKLEIQSRPTTTGFDLERNGLPAGIYTYQVLQAGQRVSGGKLWVVD